MVDEILNEKDTRTGYNKEEYIKKKKEQLNNAYKTIDEGLEEIKSNPVCYPCFRASASVGAQ